MHDIARLIWHTGPVAKAVLFILFILSVLSWAVILQKLTRLSQTGKISRKYLEIYQQKKGWSDLYQASRPFLQSPFARVFIKGFQEFYHRRKAGAEDPDTGASAGLTAAVTRVMETSVQEELARLEQNLPFLATTVSISPFLGLFGTVWGVMEAFIRIGQQGSSDISTVGPGIAEALITTVFGLFVAIPALAAHNLLVAELRKLENRLSLFSTEFILALERKQMQ